MKTDSNSVAAKPTSSGFNKVSYAFLLLAIIIGLNFWQRLLAQEAHHRVVHTKDVKIQLINLLSILKDAETGQRGFIITGREEYLEPYDSALSQINIAIKNLQHLTSDNTQQQENILNLQTLTRQKLEELELTVSLRRNFGFEDASQVVNTNEGKQIMGNIRNLSSHMYSLEQILFNQRSSKAETLKILGLLGMAFTLIILVVSTVSVIRQLSKNIEKLQQSQKETLKVNAELEEFTYRTSHDLRSPLVSSIGLLDITRNAIASDNKDKALASLTHAQKSLHALEKLIKDILQLTQIKNMDEGEEILDIKTIVNDAINKLRQLENFQRLDIQQDFRFSGTLSVKKNRFVLIIENLVSNAVKYQDLKKENSFIKISTYEEKNSFVLVVRDNGLGIPINHQDSLFQMFKRFHPKTAFGSGLGLYMIKKSTDILGGQVYFEDLSGGSVFKLKIPLKT